MTNTRYTPARAEKGMVSSAHYLASQAGVWMLRQGGNAADAAVCAAATMAVVAPHLNGIGGDMFAQVWPTGDQSPVGLNASGRSGSLSTIGEVKSRGHKAMPVRGPLSVSVPGAVSGWQALLHRFGSRRLYDVLEPAIDYAENGSPVTASIADAIAAGRDFLFDDEGLRLVFSRSGRPLKEGQVFANRELGQTLRALAATDGESFYRGDVAARLARGLDRVGSFITAEDLNNHRAEWVEPLYTTLGADTVYELPPNSQGAAALEMLNLAQEVGLAWRGCNWVEHIAELCHAIRLAIEDRDRYITDPDFFVAPTERMVSREFARARIKLAPTTVVHAPDGGTASLCVVDSNGMAVSFIQSLFQGFGSGVMVPGTGVHLNNRASYFTLNSAYVNRLEPQKRTMHTLMPGIAGRECGPTFVFGTKGGDAQPQIHLQLLLNHLVRGMEPQSAIEAPRFLWMPGPGIESRVLLEDRFSDRTTSALASAGLEVITGTGWDSRMGHAHAIAIDRSSGVLSGGADPRGDGLALGY